MAFIPWPEAAEVKGHARYEGQCGETPRRSRLCRADREKRDGLVEARALPAPRRPFQTTS